MIPTAVLLAAHGRTLESDDELQRPQRYLRYLRRAESAPTRFASWRTGVRAIAERAFTALSDDRDTLGDGPPSPRYIRRSVL